MWFGPANSSSLGCESWYCCAIAKAQEKNYDEAVLALSLCTRNGQLMHSMLVGAKDRRHWAPTLILKRGNIDTPTEAANFFLHLTCPIKGDRPESSAVTAQKARS